MIRLHKTLIYIFVAIVAVALTACGKDEPDIPDPSKPAVPVDRTVLVYMAANNNLGYGYASVDEAGRPVWVHAADSLDLDEMRTAVRNGALGTGGSLVIYHSDSKGNASLVRMRAGAQTDTLVRYSNADGLTAVHAERMRTVIADAKRLCPAESYGLVLWSHGDGWLQNGLNEEPAASAKAWGQERGRKMNITTLASVLDGQGFDYIYFDCCYMATVETIYELRNCADYIVACPSEIPREGTPWHLVLRDLFGTPNLQLAAYTTFNYYNTKQGEDRTCSISVIDTDGLDRLAEATAKIFEATSTPWPSGYSGQAFTLDSPCFYYDFAHYINALNPDPALLAEWQDAFKSIITYKAATPKLWNTLPINHNCGLTINILRSEDYAATKNYNTLSWYDTVTSHLFNK